MEKISVIVPCYNVEKEIGQCIESLLSQTIGKEALELIFVNDASTDKTLDVLKKYEKENSKSICVITYDENIRQGGARNIGLSYATGEYIGFVDADDWIEPDMYETLLTLIKCYDGDVAFCDIDYGQPLAGVRPSIRSRCEEVYSSDDYREKYPFFLNEKYSPALMNQVFRRNVIMESGVQFPEKLAYEDNYWGPLMSLFLRKIIYIPYPFYHYNVHEGSTVQKRNCIYQLDRLKIELMKLDEYKKRGLLEEYHDKIEAAFMRTFYFNTLKLLFTQFDVIPDIFPVMREIIIKEFPNVEQNTILQREMTTLDKEMLKLLWIPTRITPMDMEMIAQPYREFYKLCYNEACIEYK